ncbi:MAG: hypothetical protein ACC657_10170 [Thiohalomonadales bacterium]
MNTVCVHVDENMDSDLMTKVKLGLLKVNNISNVEMNPKQPHDILVEYNISPELPLDITNQLKKLGLHSYIWGG